jgi:ParB/RepB/Spo0J family partition protein
MGISWIELELIGKNPYQIRDHEDPEHVNELAASIKENGLMQYPEAREFEGMYQLAFGHSRFAAYKQLYLEAQDPQWFRMPIVVHELTDLQMFEHAVSENIDRQDLTPIEVAKAMVIYQDVFHKNSDEIGKFFHYSGSTVRGKIRLLGLPENIRSRVGNEISEGTARKLLSLSAVAPAEKVTAISERLVAAGPVSESFVSDQVSRALRENAHPMTSFYGRSDDNTPRGGTGLWPLTWTPGILDYKLAQVNKLFEERGLMSLKSLDGIRFPAETGGDVEGALLASDYPREQAESAATILTCLANPPACTTCALHTALDGSHYCGLKACWERKRKAWYQVELERLSKEMGIAIYDKEKDSSFFEEGATYGDDLKQYQKWIAEKAYHLRLKVAYREYSEHTLTNSYVVTVISIRPEAIKKIKAAKEREAHRGEENRNQQDIWKQERERLDASERFIKDVAAPTFSNVLNPLENVGLLEWLVDNGQTVQKLPKERKAKLAKLRVIIMSRWLENHSDYQTKKQGPVAVAAWLQGLATSFGVQLPADWLKIAEQAMPGYLAPVLAEEKADA